MKKILFYLFIYFIYSNHAYAEKFIYVCESISPKGYEGFQRTYSIDTNRKKIKHISSFDTKSKQAYNVDRFINIINWSNEFAISHKIDDADKTSSYDTFSFVNDKLIVSAHYMNGDMPISEDQIEKYYFNQLYDCIKD